MNNVTLVGRLGQDAKVNTINSAEGTRYAISFSVADDIRKGGEKSTQWHNVSYFSKTDGIAKYLTKGTAVSVIGSINYSKYTNKEGHEVPSTTIFASRVELFGSTHTDEPQQAQPTQQTQPRGSQNDLPF